MRHINNCSNASDSPWQGIGTQERSDDSEAVLPVQSCLSKIEEKRVPLVTSCLGKMQENESHSLYPAFIKI